MSAHNPAETSDTDPFPGDAETVLARGEYRLRVSSWGASLRGLWREGIAWQGKSVQSLGGSLETAQANINAARREIVTGYQGAMHKVGGQGDVLIPFPGRIRDGRYEFSGESYQMTVNDKEGPNAIHGFLRGRTWEIAEQSASAVTFATALGTHDAPGYPFALQATIEYVLETDGMTCRFAVTNTGNDPAPVAAGFHPYFAVGDGLIDDATLSLPFASVLEFDDALLPTGNVLPVESGPFDFTLGRRIGVTVFNTCFLHPYRDADGLARVRLQGKEEETSATIWMDETFDYVVVYSGDPLPAPHRRRALAIEPMTGASDVFNHPDWGLRTLAPGETLSGAWGVKEER